MTTFNLDEQINLTKATLDRFMDKVTIAANTPGDADNKKAVLGAVTLALASFGDLAINIARLAHAAERSADAAEELVKLSAFDLQAAIADGVREGVEDVENRTKRSISEEMKRTPLGNDKIVSDWT